MKKDMIDVLGLDRTKYTPEYLESRKVRPGQPCQLFDRIAYCKRTGTGRYDCESCSLVSYGRDCQNNPLPQ